MKALSVQVQTTPTLSPLFASIPLRECCLITDGNSHRPELCPIQIGFEHQDLISEAMLPEIRAVAMMIASERHTFQSRSPKNFTEEADWFAARILVLNARAFHLDISLKPMLELANQRAKAFAQQHGLNFVPAQIRSSLHAKRPSNMLLMSCAISGEVKANMVENSKTIRQQIVKFA